MYKNHSFSLNEKSVKKSETEVSIVPVTATIFSGFCIKSG